MTTDNTEEVTKAEEVVETEDAPVVEEPVELTTEDSSQQRVEQPVYPTPRAKPGDPGIGDVTERMNADIAKGYVGIRPGD